MKRLMRLVGALVVGLVCLAQPTGAQDRGMSDKQAVRVYFDSEKITVSSSAVGFTASKIAPTSSRPDQYANEASCSVEADDMRWLAVASQTPTASTGVLQKKDLVFNIYGYVNIKNFRAIRVTTDVTLNCIYSR